MQRPVAGSEGTHLLLVIEDPLPLQALPRPDNVLFMQRRRESKEDRKSKRVSVTTWCVLLCTCPPPFASIRFERALAGDKGRSTRANRFVFCVLRAALRAVAHSAPSRSRPRASSGVVLQLQPATATVPAIAYLKQGLVLAGVRLEVGDFAHDDAQVEEAVGRHSDEGELQGRRTEGAPRKAQMGSERSDGRQRKKEEGASALGKRHEATAQRDRLSRPRKAGDGRGRARLVELFGGGMALTESTKLCENQPDPSSETHATTATATPESTP